MNSWPENISLNIHLLSNLTPGSHVSHFLTPISNRHLDILLLLEYEYIRVFICCSDSYVHLFDPCLFKKMKSLVLHLRRVKFIH